MNSTHKRQLQQILTSTGTFATVLLVILLDNYGTDALGWDTDTIDREIHDDFNVIMPKLNRDKLQAAIGLVTTDLFYADWVAFNQVSETLNNDPVDFEILDPVTPEMMAWAITEAAFLEDPQDKPVFDEEVRAYMGAILYDNGVRQPRGVLNIALLPDMNTEWEADPALFTGAQAQGDSDAKAIQDYVLQHGVMLMQQLNDLPMQHRDKKLWDNFHKQATKVLMSQLESDS